jgi:hypothetical protein
MANARPEARDGRDAQSFSPFLYRQFRPTIGSSTNPFCDMHVEQTDNARVSKVAFAIYRRAQMNEGKSKEEAESSWHLLGATQRGAWRLLAKAAMDAVPQMGTRPVRTLARPSYPIYIYSPAEKPTSGGVRALYLLCQHLNRLGYRASIVEWPSKQHHAYVPSELTHDLGQGSIPIVVYPEAVPGNPLGWPFVARYLLNKPGILRQDAAAGFGKDDYFLHFAPEHVPEGRTSFDLFLPLVDRSIYYRADTARDGFVVYSNRAKVDIETFPDWLRPMTVVSRRSPRTHAELAELYRHSRAMVTSERTTAIYEAMCCGCPVICLPGTHFIEEGYQRRFGGSGLVWGWNADRVASAAAETRRFEAIYGGLEKDLDARIQLAFDGIIADVKRRTKRVTA